MTAKERLHELIDQLCEQDAEPVLVVVERRRGDPMRRALACAPLDDEPSGASEDASVAKALAAYGWGETISSKQLRTELALI
jgi:hypothetical protein